MKLPTTEETLQGIKKAGYEVSHPCFPCIFLTGNKAVMSPYNGIIIAENMFNQCQLKLQHEIVNERCPGYYYKGIKDDKFK